MLIFRNYSTIAQVTRGGSHGKLFLEYASSNTPSVSFSLPNTGKAYSHKRIENWLSGFLPDNPLFLQDMNAKVKSKDILKVLEAFGEDLPGVYSFFPEGSGPREKPVNPQMMTTVDIANLIKRLRLNLSVVNRENRKYSLAGFQNKFSVHISGNSLVSPDFHFPSTHIFKPAPEDVFDVDFLELGGQALASSVGLVSAYSEVATFHGYRSFVSTRFDRVRSGDGKFNKVALEDFAQALGQSPSRKYNIPLKDMISLVRDNLGPKQSFVFAQQVLYNTMIGNFDSHAKNYSILLDTGEISPLYDCIPLVVYGKKYSNALPQSFFGAKHAKEITKRHILDFSKLSNLHPDLIFGEIERLSTGILNNIEKVFSEIGLDRLYTVEVSDFIKDTVPRWFK